MFVGIDVAKARLVIAVHPRGEVWTTKTTAQALRALAKRLTKAAPTLIVLEASGGYEIPVIDVLLEAGLPVSLVQPARVRDYAKSQGQRAKTDVLDAKVLAAFAAQLVDPLLLSAAPVQREMMRRMLRRQQLEGMLMAERQRLDQAQLYPDSPVRADLEEMVAYLEAKLRDIDREIDAYVSMYHDQGLPVLKAVGFGMAVNVTLGLPIVRTSVDHGTAFDIAGRGVADPGSMIAAITLAANLASNPSNP